jgi:hypothetical protein
MSEIRERPPLNTKTMMVDPLGGDAGDPEAPPINVKTSMVDPLGGDARDPGAPTTQHKNVNGGPP